MIDRSAFRGTASVMARWSLTTLALAAAAVGCSGEIGTSMGGGSGTPGSGNGTGNGGNGGPGMPPPAPANFVAEQGGLRRLTVPELRNSVTDLFGGGMTISTQFEPDTALSGFASIGAARVQLSAAFVEQLEAASLEVAHKALSDVTGRATLIGCTPAGTTDDTCTSQFIRTFGRRVWRRPLTDDEVSRYAGVAKGAQTALANYFSGLEYAVAGLLQSPYFIYRMELGAAPTGNATQVAFDDYQMATRLSYFLWNTTPDDALLDAADAHQLTKSAGLTAQAQRLLASPRTSAAMQTFFTELYRLGDLDTLAQQPAIFPEVSPTLGASMRDETLKFLTNIAFTTKGDYRDIYTSTNTFVNAEMAKLYGMTAPGAGTTSVAATYPASSLRSGLLGQASFLAGNSQPTRSSPTKRGKFIREMMLCQQITAPPANVPAFPETMPGTTRQRLTQHRTDPSCAACHSLMDPVGLGLENFDGIGAFRTMEAGQPIDASGNLDAATFTGPVGLATAVRNHSQTPVCLASVMYRYAVGHVDTDGEKPAIDALVKAFSGDGYHFSALLEGMVNSPGFIYAAKPQ
ncbi:MAG TPA: DUF1592 domain-containing protein [Polyangia bacterium]|jgi:hypothetical protein|nr:DUF1592 domain-containing protein [Polyangia bacterium]